VIRSTFKEGPEKLRRDINLRLEAISIPSCWIQPFSKMVVGWTVNHGEQWTINRLKSLKVDLIRSRSNLPPLTVWVDKKHNSFTGVIGSLFRFSKESDKNFNKGLQCFMAYSIFVYNHPTSQQLEKFEKAVSSDPIPMDPNFISNFTWIARKFTGNIKIERIPMGNSLMLFRGSPSKSRPTMYWEEGRQLQSFDPLSNVNFFNEHTGAHVNFYHKFKSLYDPVLWGLDPVSSDTGPDLPVSPGEVLGGNIGLIQEPGGKLRSVANPFLVHQLALKPLGDALYKLAKQLPWDCTHDQSKPLHTLQEHLSNQNIVHSIDLSSATDLFPLRVQIDLLTSLFGEQPDIHLLEFLSKSIWKYGDSYSIRWRKGQPLGLYPSFGMFTVTHGFLLWYLNGCTHDNQFFVVGDDVVILNDNLFRKYISILGEWKIPWSPDKSISSGKICEFAGKIITSNGIFPQYKWRQTSDDNFLDICRLLGSKSRMLLRPRQKKVFDQVEHLILPFGLGFNPKGISLSDREEMTHLFLHDSVLSSSLMGLHGLISQNLYGNPEVHHGIQEVSFPEILCMMETFDKKVRSVLSSILGSFDQDSLRVPPSSLSGFSTVPGVLSDAVLPLATLRPSRTTQLDRYEEILSLISKK
jgi:hypothetical protein